MKNALIILVAGFLCLELIEHAIFPIIWTIKNRKRKSVCEVTEMIGKTGKVKSWYNSQGKIFIQGELWQAVSEFPLSEGEKAVVQEIRGLTIHVIPSKEKPNEKTQQIEGL